MAGEIVVTDNKIEDITTIRRVHGGWKTIIITIAEQLQIIKEREETYGKWDKSDIYNEYNPD